MCRPLPLSGQEARFYTSSTTHKYRPVLSRQLTNELKKKGSEICKLKTVPRTVLTVGLPQNSDTEELQHYQD